MSDNAGRCRLIADPPSSPQLSIVIPCYNSEGTLPAQLSAIARQVTRYSWEVVVADNGSRDRTHGIASAFCERIPALRVIDAAAMRGAAHARNTGANAASGQAILFCDADDVMGEGYIEAMGLALERSPFVACRYDFAKLNVSWLGAARGNNKDGQSHGLAGGYCHPTLPYAGAGGLGILKSVHHAV